MTTPFDVAKTRRQVDLSQPHHTRVFSLMKAIVAEEGPRGLWRGLTARVAKVAPSCAIMISSYEIGKKALSEHWWGLGAPPSSPSSSSSGAAADGSGSGAAGSEDQVLLLRDHATAFTILATTGATAA